MSFGSRLKALWLTCFPKPTADRALYRALKDKPLRRILEIGLGNGDRALQLLKLAQRRHAADGVRYFGIDLFEDRLQPPALPGGTSQGTDHRSLRDAYCLLRATGAKVKLIPGDPFGALAKSANGLAKIDVVVISHDVDPVSLSRAWFYVPRMLAGHALVFWADDPENPAEFREVPRQEVLALAGLDRRRRAA